jgi:hypothetical protein
MSNLLKVAMIETILSLRQRGWSKRRIARELGVDRGTIARYLRQAPQAPKPAIAPTGSPGIRAESKPAIAPTGSGDPVSAGGQNQPPRGASKPATLRRRRLGR